MFETTAPLETETALLGPPRVEMARGKVRELSARDLRRECDPATLGFGTTDEVPELKEIVGQARAEEAVRFGLAMRRPGYNFYALGPAGLGKHFVLSRYLTRQAAGEPAPGDWCYVFNFAEPQKPRALGLPAGRGGELRRQMEELTAELKPALRVAFEREDYQNRRRAIDSEFEAREEGALRELRNRARAKGLTVVRTPMGLICAPVQGDEVLSPEEVEKLSAEERDRIRREIEATGHELEDLLAQMPRWQRESKEKIRQLNQEVARFAAGSLLGEVRKSFADQEAVIRYLGEVEQDILRYAPEIVGGDEEDDAEEILGRYRINLLVDNRETPHAPVVEEDNPTWQNLLGRVEHIQEMGTLITDFTLIKPGALHRANGGYLVLDAREVLLQGFAWEGLKRCLQAGHLKIESPGQAWGLVSTVSLEPEVIPLAVKVVLVGERLLYYMLAALDPEFPELFKVAVDFEEEMDRDAEGQRLYARLVAQMVRQEGLKPFDSGAVARVLEHGSRRAGDAMKLSLHGRELLDLLREAAHWSGKESPVVTAADVQRAIDAQIHRLDRARQRLQEEVRRGTILLDTEGSVAGQVNGLSVLPLGTFWFGHPGRITASVRLGEGEVVDIDREAELSGPIHNKSVLILTGFLGGRYAGEQPLSLSASLVFEQSYGGVEGDSATLAELCALLSAISDIPLDQAKAVTGSVNQLGRVQAVGGTNEKIEGFFDICAARGLTGRQGVVIPESNVQHLMLRRDVVEAVAAGKFHIYPVATVDEGLEVLTGLPAGERDASGNYPEGSVNRAVMDRLAHMAERRRELAREEVRSFIPL